MNLTPITRKERYYAAIANGSGDVPEPITRTEKYLYAIAKGTGDVPKAITREHIYLEAIAKGTKDNLPDPVRRKDMYLKAIAEGGGDVPKPVTREELFLNAISGGESEPQDTYGVVWDYSGTGSTLRRIINGIGAAVSKPIPATSIDGTGNSPFDYRLPWSGMKRYNIIDGEVAYSEDDPEFSQTEYDTMVYIPEFYYRAKKDVENTTWTWEVSAGPQKGFEKHPGSGRYIGRYHSSRPEGRYTMFSKSGVVPETGLDLSSCSSYSHSSKAGAGWWMMDIQTWSAVQLLYLVEFADFDSQSVLGRGYPSGAEGALETGATDGAVYHTLNMSDGHNQYRWIEDPFSGCYDWCNNCLVSDGEVYIHARGGVITPSLSNMSDTGVALPETQSITGFGYSEEFPWAFIPDMSDASGANTVSDYVNSNTRERALCVGGSFNRSSHYGMFCFYASLYATAENTSVGSRLIYIP